MATRPGQWAGTPQRRRLILEAALACFDARGIESTTIDDIRRQAGVSIGSLYHHFGSKEGVAARLFIGGVGDMNADLLARLQRVHDAEAGVRTVVEQYCDWVTAHPALARFLLHSREIGFSDEARAELKQMHADYIRAVFGWFARFVEDGSMKRLPPETYVPLISGPIQDYTRAWLSGQASQPPTVVCRVFADAAWNAVRADV